MGVENGRSIEVTPLLTPHEQDLRKAVVAHQETLFKLVGEFAKAALSRPARISVPPNPTTNNFSSTPPKI